jgi:hypothetical protein
MKSITDLSLATLNASPGHRAVSQHVLGRPWANIAFMILAPAAYCLGPDAVAFEPSCKSDVPGPPFPSEEFLVTYDACSRGGCETAGGDPLDISHTGTAMATQRSGKIQTLSLLVFFTGLTATASPVVLSVEGNEAGNVHGAVRTSTRLLATIEGHFDPRAKLFSWHQPCALVP